jgi:hypothetical protein
MSKKKPAGKEFVDPKDRTIPDHPTLHETKEKGSLRLLLKKLIHVRKGHCEGGKGAAPCLIFGGSSCHRRRHFFIADKHVMI